MARPSGLNEKLRNELKTLCIDWAIARMKGKQENVKKEIVLKVLPKVFPTEVSGVDGEAIQAQIQWMSSQSPTIPASGQQDSTTQPSDGTSSSPTGEQESPLPQ